MKYCQSCGATAAAGGDVRHTSACIVPLVVSIVKVDIPEAETHTLLVSGSGSIVHVLHGKVTPPAYPPAVQLDIEPLRTPECVMGDDSYPDDDFLGWLRVTDNHALALGLAGEYFQHCGYGKYRVEGARRVLITGGWSGCEDVIEALRDNFALWVRCWSEHHRGGKWVFELPASDAEEL